jgi:high-affinity iron transporter
MSFMKNINGKLFLVGTGILLVCGILIWQAIVFSGSPDPTEKNLNKTAAILSCGILVFREGLEAILVLAAIIATVKRRQQKNFSKGITFGTVTGLIATAATWFLVVYILSNIDLPELDIQAATGLLAIVVLLLVMNWFFHRVYWTGWISHHTNRGKRLIDSTEKSSYRMFQGFALLGFTAIYREGFEIVLFLQQLRLQDGNNIVLAGAAIGIALTAIVAYLTFIANKKLPYKKMLILTGVLLTIVLFVMVGESIQEMQQANWLPTTPIDISIPDWLGMWFAIFPNIQGIAAQFLAALVVLGSYISAQSLKQPSKKLNVS